MAGRPVMMANSVEGLLERLLSLEDELQGLAPQQYVLRPTDDPLGLAWRAALDGLCNASDYLGDLAACLQHKAVRAEQRRQAVAEWSHANGATATALTGPAAAGHE